MTEEQIAELKKAIKDAWMEGYEKGFRDAQAALASMTDEQFAALLASRPQEETK